MSFVASLTITIGNFDRLPDNARSLSKIWKTFVEFLNRSPLEMSPEVDAANVSIVIHDTRKYVTIFSAGLKYLHIENELKHEKSSTW